MESCTGSCYTLVLTAFPLSIYLGCRGGDEKYNVCDNDGRAYYCRKQHSLKEIIVPGPVRVTSQKDLIRKITTILKTFDFL